MSRIYYITAMFTLLLLSGGCGYSRGEPANTETAAPQEAVSGDTAVSGDRETVSDGGEEIREEDLRLKALTQAEAMDFTIQKSPVDRERYDQRTDRVYKEAFLKAVTNQIPIYDRGGEESYFYKDLLGKTGKLPEDQFLKAVRESDYFYQDFDGDGLPELTVDTEGPCVLKYHPEEDRVELYTRKEEGWHLLGKDQMYRESTESDEGAYTYLYGYEAGEERFCLKDILHWYGGWQQEPYLVSYGEYEDMVVEEETAVELLGGYFAAVKQAPHPMTFSVLFGDGEDQGYMPGEDAPVRYGLRDRDILPVNEEKGQEWEAYKAMMEGDFSVVEGEQWVRLQSDYEDELESNDGICGWSYFLMDFNQDGVNELVLRVYPRGVNNTPFFCYEDGHIRMWGSYGSADSHGYRVPLANGKVLSVDWYQNNREWRVSRVDPECRQIGEQYYRTWESREESDGGEGEPTFPDDEGKRERFFDFLDCYHNGEGCGDPISLTEEEWGQIEDEINGLMIPEDVWKPCNVFTPMSERPEVPGVG